VRRTAALFPFLTLALLVGCEDPNDFTVDPLITVDTIDVATPTSATGLPTAIDVTSSGGQIAGGRRPETQQDAERWDLAVRARDGALVFVPAAALGLSATSGITMPLAGQTFDSVIEAPGAGTFITDDDVPVQQGAVYVVRSRNVPCGFGTAAQYSKIQPLEVSVEEGTIRLQISTNEVCGDPRLVPEG
jgi:hypothetical protein